MSKPRPICVSCQVEYQCHKNGFVVGEAEDAAGFPITMWRGDCYKCPGCDHKMVIGFSGGYTEVQIPEDKSRALPFYYNISDKPGTSFRASVE